MVTKIHEKNNKTIAKTKKISYTKIREKRKQKEEVMEGANAETLEKLEREREREKDP